MALASLVGVSAFAESRPENGTRVRRDAGGVVRRERAAAVREERRGNESSNRSRAGALTDSSRRRSGSSIDVRGSRPDAGVERRAAPRVDARGDSRRDGSWRGNDRREGGRDEAYRGRGNSSRGSSDRYHGRNDGRSNSSYRHGRQPYYAHGRVSRFHRHGNGYRVWIHGAPYPFFIPAAHWHRDRFRVGVMINLGGYYNPGGYYDYYDGRSRGELRGVVESVDYRRNTFVVRNEASGSFVTVRADGYEADRVRAGDYVELYGDWTRSGYFRAHDVDLIDSYRRW